MHESVYNFLTNINELNVINFNNTFENFVSLIQTVIENHAPLKRQSRKHLQRHHDTTIKSPFVTLCQLGFFNSIFFLILLLIPGKRSTKRKLNWCFTVDVQQTQLMFQKAANLDISRKKQFNLARLNFDN